MKMMRWVPLIVWGSLVGSDSALCRSATGQVISAQSAATIAPADCRGSTRLQYGLTQPQTYQGAILGGACINSDQQSAIAADGGFTTSSNPIFWSQTAGNTFQLSYTAATQTLNMRVLRPSGAQQFSISDIVDLTGAGGLNLDFAALNLSTFGGIQLTSAGQTVALGPNGLPWSSTDLANSTLTGWNLGADWSMTGSVLLLAGGDAVPRLQGDILAPGLAYQLSHVSGAPRQQVYNYGIISDMVVSDTDFLQSTFGGIDGIIEADISSAAAVTFNVAGNQQYSGSITDLTTSLVASEYRGTASLVKRGVGTLTLTEASNYNGQLHVMGGTVRIRQSSNIGAGGLELGDGILALDGPISIGPLYSLVVSGQATITAGSVDEIEIAAVLQSAAGTSLRLQSLHATLAGPAIGFCGTMIADAGSLDAPSTSLGGALVVAGGCSCVMTGSIAGDLTIGSGSVSLEPGPGTTAASLSVGGNLAASSSGLIVLRLFLEDCRLAERCCDTMIIGGQTSVGEGQLLLPLDLRNSDIPLAPAEGLVERWPVIQCHDVPDFPGGVVLRLTSLDGTTQDILLDTVRSTTVGEASITVLRTTNGLVIEVRRARTQTEGPCDGDILVDRRIDGADLGALLSYWGPVTSSPISQGCDIDKNGIVNGADLGILLANWGPCAK
jgi:autotransporter-associated beta strand protein